MTLYSPVNDLAVTKDWCLDNHPDQDLISRVLKRIEVQMPYFALEDLYLNAEHCFATAYAECLDPREQGPMTAAELGRHAAILGSSHAALLQKDDTRRYYLAQEATCRYFVTQSPFGSPVRFRSKVLTLTKNALVARVEASCHEQTLALFEIRYSILKEDTFQRLFAKFAQETPGVHEGTNSYRGTNPYKSQLCGSFELGETWAKQSIEKVEATVCAGHFPMYPALPVAALMGQLCFLAGQLIGQPFRAVSGTVTATDLCWAGQGVQFLVQQQTLNGDNRFFNCQVTSGEKSMAHMQAVFQGLG